MGCSGTMTRGEDLSFLGSYHIAGRGCNCGAASVFPLFTNQIMFMDCLLLSKAQTFHIHILLPPGDRGGAGRWNIEDASQKLQTSYSTCVGDTPVYAMVLKLPCTHLPSMSLLPQCGTFTCPSTSSKPRGQDPSISAPCSAEPTVSSLPLLSLACSLWVPKENNVLAPS